MRQPENPRPMIDQAEEIVSAIWSELLGVPEVGRHDNFFELGGNSLQATRVMSRLRALLSVDLPVEYLFEAPTLADLADAVREVQATQAQTQATQAAATARGESGDPSGRWPTSDGPIPREYPVSFAQQRLWFLQRLDPASTAYNVAEAIRVDGPVEVGVLVRCLAEIAGRHEVLRSRFAETPDGPVASVAAVGPVPCPVIDLGGLPAGEQAAECQRVLAAEAARPFDLAAGPLLRAVVVRLSAQRHVLGVMMHHIVTDGWSMGVLWAELAVLYEAALAGQPCPLPPLGLQYGDYAAWQRQRADSGAMAGQVAYWRTALAAAPAVLELPADHPRPAARSFRGGRHPFTVPPDVLARLRALGAAEGQGTTLFMTLLAAFTVLLARYTGQDDIVVGSPIAGRTRAELEGLIGFFVNTLALRTDLSGEPSFRELLSRVREAALGGYAHQDLPFEKLVAELAPERTAAHNPLFQVMFVLHNAAPRPVTLPGLATEPIHIPNQTAKFDLKLHMTERDGELDCFIEYSSDLFDTRTVWRIADQFLLLIEQILDAPDEPIHSYSLITPPSRGSLPDPTAPLLCPEYPGIVQMFTEWADRAPDQAAIRQRGRSWTYAELRDAATGIAQVLVGHGVAPGDAVALTGPRGFGLLAGMIGILRAGGVVLPVDPALPARRRSLLCREGMARWVVHAGPEDPGADRTGPTGTRSVWVHPETGKTGNTPPTAASAPAAGADDERPLPEVRGDDPAYILFTSGTTGNPKAVLGSHKGLSHFVAWERETFGIGPGDRFAQLTSLSFDPVLRDIFVPLASGATVCLPDEEVPRPPAVLSWLEREGVSILHTIPSFAHWWLSDVPADVSLRALRHVLFAGEPLQATLVDRWRTTFPEAGAVANLYGPTETTQSKCFSLIPDVPATGVQPVGRPLPHSQALVLTRTGRLCGPGELGEIVIRTPFRSLGYLNTAGEDQRRFTPNPFGGGPDDIVYYSGDLGRYADDGTLHIAGRVDDQVKIRGVRIEPAEISAVLGRQPGVDRCTVVARTGDDGRRSLVGYVVAAAQPPPSAADLAADLSHELPAVMIPKDFVFLPTLPLTPNGKVDRDRLPPPVAGQGQTAARLPASPTEEAMARLWAEALGITRVGIDDNFFALGGDSLLAAQLVFRIQDRLGVQLPLVAVFQAQTVARLSARVEQARAGQADAAGAHYAAAIPRRVRATSAPAPDAEAANR